MDKSKFMEQLNAAFGHYGPASRPLCSCGFVVGRPLAEGPIPDVLDIAKSRRPFKMVGEKILLWAWSGRAFPLRTQLFGQHSNGLNRDV